MAKAPDRDLEVGNLVVEDPADGRPPVLTRIQSEAGARRMGIGSRMLLEMIQQHLAHTTELDAELELEWNDGFQEFLLAHGFETFYNPNLPPGKVSARRRLDRPAKEIIFAWDERGFFEQAKSFFVDRFLTAYSPFSEEELGLKAATKEEWLQRTFDEEVALQSQKPERYRWLIAHDVKRGVFGLAILDLKPTGVVGCYVRQIAAKQGLGMGKHLVKEIASRLAELQPGVDKIYAMTRRCNNRSQSFLRKLGFTVSQRKEEGYASDEYMSLEADFSELSHTATSSSSVAAPRLPPKCRAFAKPSMLESWKWGLQLDYV